MKKKSEFSAKYNTWNIFLDGEKYAEVTYNSRFSKEHVEACVREQHSNQKLIAKKKS